jgi:hypothetical protein
MSDDENAGELTLNVETLRQLTDGEHRTAAGVADTDTCDPWCMTDVTVCPTCVTHCGEFTCVCP